MGYICSRLCYIPSGLSTDTYALAYNLKCFSDRQLGMPLKACMVRKRLVFRTRIDKSVCRSKLPCKRLQGTPATVTLTASQSLIIAHPVFYGVQTSHDAVAKFVADILRYCHSPILL